MKLFFEKYSPLIISLLFTVAMYYYKEYFSNFNQLFEQLTTNALSISGTLIGFFLTILTIIHTINTRRMRFIRENGLLPRIIGYLSDTIVFHLVVISVCLFLPVIKQLTFLKSYSIQGKLSICFLIIFTWAISIRFTYFFVRLFKDSDSNNSGSSSTTTFQPPD